MTLSRRALLSALVSSAAFAKKKIAFDRPLGVQLYSVRTVLPKEPNATLQAIAAIGYKEVECSAAELVKYAPLYKEFGLTAVSIHADTNLILNGGFEATVEDAHAQGLKFVVMPYVAPKLRGSLDVFRQMADKMNVAGELCAKAGIQFCYHNHAFEFEGKQGERPWDIFTQRWDKKLVALEVDVFWLSVAGNNPSDMLRQFAGRVPLVHLKDKGFGVPVQYTETVNPSDFRAVGTGMLDFVSILKACEKAGVQHYLVEQDQTPGPPVDSLRLSYNNLRKLDLKR